jgi:hypothetical protein
MALEIYGFNLRRLYFVSQDLAGDGWAVGGGVDGVAELGSILRINCRRNLRIRAKFKLESMTNYI